MIHDKRTTTYEQRRTTNKKLQTTCQKLLAKNYLPILALLLLFACSSEELPPSPPEPGSAHGIGSAIGGVQVSPAVLPAWAAPLMYTDITPTLTREGDLLSVTVSKDYLNSTLTADKKFYVHAAMYVFNRDARVWERFTADTSSSGRIVKKWAENKATFLVPVNSPRFSAGLNFLIVYWCIDTGLRDGQGFKIWNCNGRRWGLGAFEMQGSGFPNILIERDIGNNRYLNSSRQVANDGVEYSALYSEANLTTSVQVTQLSNLSSYKHSLSSNLAILEALWVPQSSVCGFYQHAQSRFTWLSGSNRVVVQTFGSALDQAKVSAYNLRYPSNCDLLDELRRSASGLGACGDGVVDANEECDGLNDSACPGLCKPDCGCSLRGAANTGVCGDFRVQSPNSQGVFETCEPPEKRNAIGNLVSGSPCYIRDASGAITQRGHCDAGCACVPGEMTFPSCGNGRCESGESISTCSADCPSETNPPNITVVAPLPNQVFNSTVVVYTVLASDDSGVASCKASTDNGPKEVMTGIGGVWKLTKLFFAGSHSLVVECVDHRSNAGNASVNFSIAPIILFGNYNVTVLDQQNKTIDDAQVSLLKNNASIAIQATVNGSTLFPGLRYGEYDVHVKKLSYLPALVQISLIAPYLETYVYLTSLLPPPGTNITAPENQSCTLPVDPWLANTIGSNPDEYCSGFIMSSADGALVIPPVFVQRFSSVPNGVPNLVPPIVQGVFNPVTRFLTCTIPCNVEVKSKCLKAHDMRNPDYTVNEVVNWMCDAYPACTSTTDCGVSETCMQGLCRSS